MGGILPGILMGVAMMIVAVKYGISHKDVKRTPFSLKNLLQKFVKAIGALLVPVIILGGIYGGIFTPTEAAGVACAYGLIVGIFIYRELNPKELKKAFVGSGSTTGMVLFIMAAAAMFGYIMTRYQLTNSIANFIIAVCGNKYLFLLLVNILLLVVGCFWRQQQRFLSWRQSWLRYLVRLVSTRYTLVLLCVSTWQSDVQHRH